MMGCSLRMAPVGSGTARLIRNRSESRQKQVKVDVAGKLSRSRCGIPTRESVFPAFNIPHVLGLLSFRSPPDTDRQLSTLPFIQSTIRLGRSRHWRLVTQQEIFSYLGTSSSFRKELPLTTQMPSLSFKSYRAKCSSWFSPFWNPAFPKPPGPVNARVHLQDQSSTSVAFRVPLFVRSIRGGGPWRSIVAK
jgi:hypothetical protein